MVVEVEVHTSVAEMRIVECVEGVEAVGILFCRAVPAQQASAEIDANLGNHGVAILVLVCSKLHARYEVFSPVSPKLSYRKLRASEYDGLGEVFEHE